MKQLLGSGGVVVALGTDGERIFLDGLEVTDPRWLAEGGGITKTITADSKVTVKSPLSQPMASSQQP
jgi:hypothetical protein